MFLGTYISYLCFIPYYLLHTKFLLSLVSVCMRFFTLFCAQDRRASSEISHLRWRHIDNVDFFFLGFIYDSVSIDFFSCCLCFPQYLLIETYPKTVGRRLLFICKGGKNLNSLKWPCWHLRSSSALTFFVFIL